MGSKAEYPPHLVARVFKLHLINLLKDISDLHILGIPVAHVYVIKFPMRGLPHYPMLTILIREENMLKNQEDVGRLITAEIPVPENGMALHYLVKPCMIHIPCGTVNPTSNPTSVCMEDGECKKGFPKEF